MSSRRAAVAGITMTYTSGCPSSQKRFSYSQTLPPIAG